MYIIIILYEYNIVYNYSQVRASAHGWSYSLPKELEKGVGAYLELDLELHITKHVIVIAH